jgi:hypothetical protein
MDSVSVEATLGRAIGTSVSAPGSAARRFQLVRVVPFEEDLVARRTVHLRPDRAGLTVQFHARRTTEPHAGLH